MNQTQKSGWNHLKLPTHAEPSLPHADVIGMDRIGDELFELLPRNALRLLAQERGGRHGGLRLPSPVSSW